MLYASTKASLKKDFGGAHIYDDLYGNVKEDITLNGYERHVKHEESEKEAVSRSCQPEHGKPQFGKIF